MMKKTLLSLTLLIFSITAMAQLDKNNWLVGGSGSFYRYNQDYTSTNLNFTAKYTSIYISATAGYFIMDKFATGLRPSYSYLKGKVGNQGDVSESTKFYIGPFARYYFLNTDKQYNILADVCFQYGINKIPLPPKNKGEFTNLSIMVGPEIFFNSAVGIEVLVGYKATTETINNSANSYSDLRKGFLTSVGFQFHLEKL